MTVPLVHEIQTSLLHPAVEIAWCDLVGIVEHAIFGSKNLHRSFLDRGFVLVDDTRHGDVVPGCSELPTLVSGDAALFARVAILAEDAPRVLPPRDGVVLKTRFRRAIGISCL